MKPFEAHRFPFARHFLKTGLSVFAGIKTRLDLEKAAREYDHTMSSPLPDPETANHAVGWMNLL